MKKAILYLVLIVALILLSGCSNQSSNKELSSRTMKTPQPINITFLGTSSTGPGLITLNGLAECINRSYPGSAVTIVPGNFGTNITRINNREGNIGITDNCLVVAAVSGNAPFNKKITNIASVAYIQPTYYQIVVDSDLGIESFDEFIAGKMKLRISSGLAGGTSNMFLVNLLAEYGLTINDINDWGCEVLFQGVEESAQMLGDDRIDMMIVTVYAPTPTIQELSKNKKIKLLSLTPAIIDSLCDKHGYYKTKLPDETYDFLEEDLETLKTNTILIVPEDSDVEEVYKITKSIGDNLEYFRTVHTCFADLNIAKMAEKLDLPMHPGAEKYYREIGIIK